jgi:hypothetical protein
MRRPGFLQDYQGYTPRKLKEFRGLSSYAPFGSMPPSMGPLIPGPPSPSPRAPIPHPWSSGHVSRGMQRTCPSC